MLSEKFIVVFVFLAVLGLTIFFDSRKTKIVWAAVAILFLTGCLTVRDAFYSVDWNVLLLYLGMLVTGETLIYSKMPDYIATHLASKTKTVGMAMLVICVFAGVLSMFIMNIAVVLLLAPVALLIAKKVEVSPVPLFIGIALMANLEGASTLIGDPPSMLLGSFEGYTFNDFIFFGGKPSMFFAVQAAALAAIPLLYLYFRRYDHKMPEIKPEGFVSIIPTVFVVLMIGSLAASSSFSWGVPYPEGLICLFFGALNLIWYLHHRRGNNVREFVHSMDWHTAVFLVGIFMLIGCLSSSGIVEDAARHIVKSSGNSPLRAYVIINVVSLAVSAFVLNIPYLAVMTPVAEMIAWQVNVNPHALFFGLLLSGSVGGNITPFGASANVVALGTLKEHGYDSKSIDFIKIGLPFALVSTLVGSTIIWLLFS
ncbi:MAG: SLC13 family permease [Candidatus Altiarchaeota archaeon]